MPKISFFVAPLVLTVSLSTSFAEVINDDLLPMDVIHDMEEAAKKKKDPCAEYLRPGSRISKVAYDAIKKRCTEKTSKPVHLRCETFSETEVTCNGIRYIRDRGSVMDRENPVKQITNQVQREDSPPSSNPSNGVKTAD